MISQWDQVAQRAHAPGADNFNNSEFTTINNDYQRIFEKSFSDPAISMHWLSELRLEQE
jgi:hypothetical protein